MRLLQNFEQQFCFELLMDRLILAICTELLIWIIPMKGSIYLFFQKQCSNSGLSDRREDTQGIHFDVFGFFFFQSEHIASYAVGGTVELWILYSHFHVGPPECYRPVWPSQGKCWQGQPLPPRRAGRPLHAFNNQILNNENCAGCPYFLKWAYLSVHTWSDPTTSQPEVQFSHRDSVPCPCETESLERRTNACFHPSLKGYCMCFGWKVSLGAFGPDTLLESAHCLKNEAFSKCFKNQVFSKQILRQYLIHRTKPHWTLQ